MADAHAFFNPPLAMSSDSPSADAVTHHVEPKPPWLDTEAYPFDSNYLDMGPGRLHYVDEGEGRPVVLLHGNPTWSFVYRHLIEGLSDSYRCIAPDLFGFGLSDKPRDWSYRVRDHAAIVEQFVEELGLSEITFVGQDWGGPAAINYAIEHPDDVDAFVLMNTAMWPQTEDPVARTFGRVMNTPLPKLLDRRYNVPVDWIMPRFFGDKSAWTPMLRRHYAEPLNNPADRKGAITAVRELTGSAPFLAELWEQRETIAGMPALLCWGMQGPVFRRAALGRWQALFPEARTVEYPKAGHFVQEERSEAVTAAIDEFLADRQSTH